MHHLTHAANQLESAFSNTFELRKCGVETPDAQGGESTTEEVKISLLNSTPRLQRRGGRSF